MKVLLFMIALGSLVTAYGQVEIPENREYLYHPDQRNYYFLWNSSQPQSLHFDSVTFNTPPCTVHIYNNSNDTILLGRAGSTNVPLHWFYKGLYRGDLLYPGDTLTLRSHFGRRHGRFHRPVTVDYQTSGNNDFQHFTIRVSGYYYDKALMDKLRAEKEGRPFKTAAPEPDPKPKVFPPYLNDPNKLIEERKHLNVVTYRRYAWGGIIEAHYNRQGELYKTVDSEGRTLRYHYNGNLRSEECANVPSYAPVFTEYDFDGNLLRKRYKNNEIKIKEYRKNGILKSAIDSSDNNITYHANGQEKLKVFARPIAGSPLSISYFENGNVYQETFDGDSINTYSKFNSGELKEVYKMTDTYRTTTTIKYYTAGILDSIAYHRSKRLSQRNLHVGTFKNGQLQEGTVTYYGDRGNIYFVVNVSGGQRDSVLSQGELQGNQINLVDENGERTGMWITQGNYPASPISFADFTKTFEGFYGLSSFQYEYLHGDTITRKTFYRNGELKSIHWISDREKRLASFQPLSESYHRNGFVASKNYLTKSGKPVRIEYDKETKNSIVAGSLNSGRMFFENGKLVRVQYRKSPPAKPDDIIEQLDEIVEEPNASPRLQSKGYSCMAEGTFKNFELYNGYFHYGDLGTTYARKERVVNGVIQYNPRVTFQSEKLLKIALEYDLNFNGYVESKELNSVTFISLNLSTSELEKFPYAELRKFRKINHVNVNGLNYQLSKYSSNSALKTAIQKQQGSQPHSRDPRVPWDGRPTPPYFRPIKEKPVEFPDVDAQYPGGHSAMFKFFEENIQRVENPTWDPDEQGRIYVGFVVEIDGSITNVKILRGLSKEANREVIRLVRSMPKWKPGELAGRPVRSYYRIPITFGVY